VITFILNCYYLNGVLGLGDLLLARGKSLNIFLT